MDHLTRIAKHFVARGGSMYRSEWEGVSLAVHHDDDASYITYDGSNIVLLYIAINHTLSFSFCKDSELLAEFLNEMFIRLRLWGYLPSTCFFEIVKYRDDWCLEQAGELVKILSLHKAVVIEDFQDFRQDTEGKAHLMDHNLLATPLTFSDCAGVL